MEFGLRAYTGLRNRVWKRFEADVRRCLGVTVGPGREFVLLCSVLSACTGEVRQQAKREAQDHPRPLYPKL